MCRWLIAFALSGGVGVSVMPAWAQQSPETPYLDEFSLPDGGFPFPDDGPDNGQDGSGSGGGDMPLSDEDLHEEELRSFEELEIDPQRSLANEADGSEQAEEEAGDGFVYGAAERERRLERLFEVLSKSPSEQVSRRINASIQALWNQSGSATVDLLIERARDAFAEERYDVTLDLVDQALMIDPHYAEAWNLRATLNYVRGDFAKSMSDIERVLTYEPRHYGALVGLGSILMQSGEERGALDVYRRVLELDPALEAAKERVESLERTVGRQDI